MIKLENNDFKAGLTNQGACLIYFNHINASTALRPCPTLLNDPVTAAYFPCVPYFGRIGKALLYEGNSWPLAPTHTVVDPKHAIHGEGWLRQWDIEEHSDSHVVMSLLHDGCTAPQFPYPWRARQCVTLSANKLHIQLSIDNLYKDKAPMGLGMHPFFRRTSSTRLSMTCDSLFTPPGMPHVKASDLQFTNERLLPDFLLDHSVENWNGQATIIDDGGANHRTKTIHIVSDAPFAHLYMPPGEEFFCLEPISHLPGAFDDEQMMESLLLDAGASKTISMSISIND